MEKVGKLDFLSHYYENSQGPFRNLSMLPLLIRQYGLPQEWNHDGGQGPDRYIEAQVWDERPLLTFLPG